ncbi:unnamed protein product [Closterium sp. Naga37s-1]|nr:unnamed protein product [Closterium sp. Naga37s-1]
MSQPTGCYFIDLRADEYLGVCLIDHQQRIPFLAHETLAKEVGVVLLVGARRVHPASSLTNHSSAIRARILRRIPRRIPRRNPKGTAVRSAAAGGLHSLAVSEQGELFTWGYGGFGALGHGEFTRRDVPCHVAPSDWLEEGVEIKSAAAGGSHTLGLSTVGRVYAWGRDEGEGRLGIPHIVDAIGEEGCVPRPIPVEFPTSQGLPRGGVSLVACGGFFSAAVDCEGGVWTWGGNHNGELGRASSGLVPSRISTITTPVTHLAAGGFHTLAVDDEGRVWSWGRGGSGQLGQHSLLTQPVPRVVPGLAGVKIARVAAGSAWSAAVSGGLVNRARCFCNRARFLMQHSQVD